MKKRSWWIGLVLIALGAVGHSFFSSVGADLYHRFFPDNSSSQLSVDQKWEIFSVLYAGASFKELEEGSNMLKWFGAQPYYRHTIQIENIGEKEAQDVKVEIAGLKEDYKLLVEPSILDPRISPLVPQYSTSNMENDVMGPSHYFRIVTVPVLPSKTNIKIVVSYPLVQPTAFLTKAQNVITAVTEVNIKPVNEAAEKARLDMLIQTIFSHFPPVNRDLWETLDIKTTVEFHPTEPLSRE